MPAHIHLPTYSACLIRLPRHVTCPYPLSFFYMQEACWGGKREGGVEELMVMFSPIIIIPLEWLIMWTFENSDLKKKPFSIIYTICVTVDSRLIIPLI